MQQFDKVYQENKEFVWKTISRYADSEHDREDIFQDVFVRISGSLNGFKGRSDIKTWIYRISVNTAINHLKKRKAKENILAALMAALPFLKDHHSGPEAEDDMKDIRFLNALDPRQRAVLIMSEVEEMKHSEISGILKIPIGTVKSTLSRAKEKARNYLRKEQMDGKL